MVFLTKVKQRTVKTKTNALDFYLCKQKLIDDN